MDEAESGSNWRHPFEIRISKGCTACTAHTRCVHSVCNVLTACTALTHRTTRTARTDQTARTDHVYYAVLLNTHPGDSKNYSKINDEFVNSWDLVPAHVNDALRQPWLCKAHGGEEQRPCEECRSVDSSKC